MLSYHQAVLHNFLSAWLHSLSGWRELWGQLWPAGFSAVLGHRLPWHFPLEYSASTGHWVISVFFIQLKLFILFKKCLLAFISTLRVWVLCLHVYLSTMCVAPTEAIKEGCWIPRDRSYRHNWASMWMPGMESRSLGRVVSAFNGWTIAKNLFIYYFYYLKLCVCMCVCVCTECRCLWGPEA